MQLEFHQLDRRWEHLRVRHPARQRRLLASLADSGQQTPIVVVAIEGQADRNMNEKLMKLPGPDHPISIERNPSRVIVSVAGRVIADTRNALTLREAAYPPVQYIPGEDVDFSQLERVDHVTYCPYKGDCNYYSVPAGGKKSVNAVWSYQDPFPAVAQIKGHVAFYPERVDEIAEQLPI